MPNKSITNKNGLQLAVMTSLLTLILILVTACINVGKSVGASQEEIKTLKQKDFVEKEVFDLTIKHMSDNHITLTNSIKDMSKDVKATRDAVNILIEKEYGIPGLSGKADTK